MDTPDPKDNKCIIHIHSLRIVRARVQLINVEKPEWYSIMGKKCKTSEPSLWGVYDGKRPI